MRPIEIVEAPSVLGLFPRGVERLPDALRAAGLHEALDDPPVHRLVPPPFVDAVEPESGLNNGRAIVTFAEELADVVGGVLERGAFPLVLGGDCSNVFGPLLALDRRGPHGLLFLDGHADFAHPFTEPSGEAASMDLALATGRGPTGFGPIGGRRRLVSDERVCVFGYRVHTCDGAFIGDTPITALDVDEVRAIGLGAAVAQALDVVTSGTDGFWVHLDADVLDDTVMPAVDYRNAGGMSWAELGTTLSAALADVRCRGLDVAIFNPTLDPDGTIANDLAALLVRCIRGDAPHAAS
jgi:arginase